jgi:transposase-like protein
VTDTCPNCQQADVEPAASRTDGTQLTDRYRCPRCGHGWITRRDTAAYQGYDPAAEDVA